MRRAFITSEDVRFYGRSGNDGFDMTFVAKI